MNIIEQAAKRIEELRRSGVDVPWTATGVDKPASGSASAAGASAPAMSGDVAATAPAGEPSPLRAVLEQTAANETAAAPALREAPQSKPARRSREVELDLRALSSKGFLVPGEERSQMEEEFRIIKRPLLQNATGESAAPIDRANLIMVTSALPGEGKTFTAINLAMSIAMELDHTVLLVDADVVCPAVLDRLGVRPAKGLLDLLANPGGDLSDVLLRTNIPKLSILPAGTTSHRTTELLASDAMEKLLDDLATHYRDRIIIFDAPPLLPTTESRVLASLMGQVVVVVESNMTSHATVSQAYATLENCPVVMGVLNKHRGRAPNSVYGYYASPPRR